MMCGWVGGKRGATGKVNGIRELDKKGGNMEGLKKNELKGSDSRREKSRVDAYSTSLPSI